MRHKKRSKLVQAPTTGVAIVWPKHGGPRCVKITSDTSAYHWSVPKPGGENK